MTKRHYLQVMSDWVEAQNLRASRKAVLQKIVRHASKSGTSYPGQRRIAQATGLSLSTVKDGIMVLLWLGLITRRARQRAGGGRGRNSDEYTLKLGRFVNKKDSDQAEKRLRAHRKRHNNTSLTNSRPKVDGRPLVDSSIRVDGQPLVKGTSTYGGMKKETLVRHDQRLTVGPEVKEKAHTGGGAELLFFGGAWR